MKSFYFVPVAADRGRQMMIAGGVWLSLAAISVFLFFFNPASPANRFLPEVPLSIGDRISVSRLRIDARVPSLAPSRSDRRV